MEGRRGATYGAAVDTETISEAHHRRRREADREERSRSRVAWGLVAVVGVGLIVFGCWTATPVSFGLGLLAVCVGAAAAFGLWATRSRRHLLATAAGVLVVALVSFAIPLAMADRPSPLPGQKLGSAVDGATSTGGGATLLNVDRSDGRGLVLRTASEGSVELGGPGGPYQHSFLAPGPIAVVVEDLLYIPAGGQNPDDVEKLIVAYDRRGQEVWRRRSAGGTESSEEPLAAYPDGTTALKSCPADAGSGDDSGCRVIGVGPDGRQRWTYDQPDGLRLVEPRSNGRRGGGTSLLRHIVVGYRDGGSDDVGELVLVDVDGVGREVVVAHAVDTAFVSDDAIALSGRGGDPERCQLSGFDLDGRRLSAPAALPCPPFGFALVGFLAVGRALSSDRSDSVVDLRSGRVFSPEAPGTQLRVASGRVVEKKGRTVRVRAGGADQETITFRDVDFTSYAAGTMVVGRHQGGGTNPFRQDLTVVEILDPATGRRCATWRMAADQHVTLAPLEGCRAVVTLDRTSSVIVGRS